MFGYKNPIKSYREMDNRATGAAFEVRWLESVIMVLKFIQNDQYTPVAATKKLVEVTVGLDHVQNNLNVQLGLKHMVLLKHVYIMSIDMINKAIQTNNMSLLSSVIESLQIIIAPYKKTQALIK